MKVLTVLFWLLAVPTGVLATVILLMTLGGRKLSAATPLWLSLLSTAAVLSLLVWAYRMAGDRPGLACIITVASWFAFAITMTVNGLLRQTNWN